MADVGGLCSVTNGVYIVVLINLRRTVLKSTHEYDTNVDLHKWAITKW